MPAYHSPSQRRTKEAVPNVRAVAVLGNADELGMTPHYRAAEVEAKRWACRSRRPNPNARRQQALIEKIEALPAEHIAEIEDFVDFIHLQDRALTRAAAISATLGSSRLAELLYSRDPSPERCRSMPNRFESMMISGERTGRLCRRWA